MLLARAVIAYGLTLVSRDLTFKWKHVLFWGDLRGAISLALALSLSAGTPDRTQIQAMAFGVVLFTLLVKGLSLAPLFRWLKLSEQTESQQEYERRYARAVATRSAYLHLEKMNQDGLLSDFTWQHLAPSLERRSKTLTQAVRESLVLLKHLAAPRSDGGPSGPTRRATSGSTTSSSACSAPMRPGTRPNAGPGTTRCGRTGSRAA